MVSKAVNPAAANPAFHMQVLSVISSGQTLLRAPGAAVYYADNLHNVPPAFVKLLSTFPTVHNVSIFLTIRQVRRPR